MLTREQVYNLLILRKREGTIFHHMPSHLIQRISDCGQEPTNAISRALMHAASATQSDVDALIKMLVNNPRLLLQAGHVITPGGLEIHRTTIYEFCLGSGDIDLANQVALYFSSIEGGEEQRLLQLKRYLPHLVGLTSQIPYPITPIFDLLCSDSPHINLDVKAILANNHEHRSELGDALNAFREAHRPKQPLVKPQMHFNYATQKALYETLYTQEMWNRLYQVSGNNHERIDVVWLKMISYLMNFYPGIDRCMTAQGAWVAENVAHVNRNYQLKHCPMKFPSYGQTTPRGKLGDDFGISLDGGASSGNGCRGKIGDMYRFSTPINYKIINVYKHLECLFPTQLNRPGL